MPVKLKIDWTLAYNLFTTGLTFREIADQVGCRPGTLRQYARRNNWSHEVSQARHAVSRVVQNMVQKEPLTIQKRAEAWQEREVNAVESITAVLDRVPIPEKIRDLREHIEVRAMNGKYGRSTFGLDQAQGAVNISIGMFGKGAIEPCQDQIIDVEPTPQLPQDTPPT